MPELEILSNEQKLLMCGESKDFFFSEYYRIPVVGKGSTPFVQRDYQRFVSQKIETEKLIIGLKARQIGWTTIGVGNAVHDALFSKEHPWLFVSRTEDAAQKMLDKAWYAYAKLPAWMRQMLPRLESKTQSAMIFANGSRIESVPATGSTGRGDSVYGALLDECAFMDYAEEIWGAVEPLVYGTAMLFSTANGMGNFFHEVWLDAQREDSVWEDIFFPWDVVPSRDQAWYDHTKMSFRGREWLFYQEYPSTPEEAFAKSGRVAFAAEHVNAAYEQIEPSRKLQWVIGSDPVEIDLVQPADIEVFIWKEPEVKRDVHKRPLFQPNYVVAADVAEGLDHGDWSYVTVFDANTGEQCMSCKSAIPVSYLDELIAWAGYEYMTALVIPERNNAGILPIDRLYRDHWYPRMYRMDTFGEFRESDRTPRYGWRTDKATKPKMVNDFIYALTEGRVILHDPDFIIESQTFVADGKGSYSATANNHDDVIMGTLIAWQGVLDSPAYPIVWRDEMLLPPTHDEIDALIFADDNDYAVDILDRPLGQVREDKRKKTFLLTAENFRHGGL
jgi:hypothetical protein